MKIKCKTPKIKSNVFSISKNGNIDIKLAKFEFRFFYKKKTKYDINHKNNVFVHICFPR